MDNVAAPVTNPRAEISGRIETGAHLLFVIAIVAVFQSGSETLHQIGLALLLAGAIGSVVGLILKAAPWQRVLERLTVLGMLSGIIAMFQPWNIVLYENGFYILAIATLSFIIVLHIPVRDIT